jgi:hypothetical protein
MNRLLIVAILIIGTLPLYAQGQQPNSAELAQKVVGIKESRGAVPEDRRIAKKTWPRISRAARGR